MEISLSDTQGANALALSRVKAAFFFFFFKAAFLTEIRPVLSPDLWLLCKNQGGLKLL